MIGNTSQHIYVRLARLIRVIDADTIEAELDLGFKIKWTTHVRFAAFDAYETRGSQASPFGAMAAAFLARLFADYAQDGRFYLYADRDKVAIYNRVEARIFLEQSQGIWLDVIETLRANGFEKGGTPGAEEQLIWRTGQNIVSVALAWQ